MDDFKKNSYHIQTKQTLTVSDKTKKKAMADNMLEKSKITQNFSIFSQNCPRPYMIYKLKVNMT